MNFKRVVTASSIFLILSCSEQQSDIDASQAFKQSNNQHNKKTKIFSFSGHIKIKSIDTLGNASFSSNEIFIRFITRGGTLTWSEPTRTVSGDCIKNKPLSYSIGFRRRGFEYRFFSGDNLANIGVLQCNQSVGDEDNFCKSPITNCIFTLNASPF